jgi:AcrR family transcriptional regulator
MQKRSVETKGKIMQAAQDLFSRSGFESASVSEICRVAGISKGAFYHHFPSKQSVFMELLTEWLRGLDEALEDLQSNQPDVSQSLIQMSEILPAIIKTSDGRLPIFLEFWAHAARDPAVWKTAIAPFRKYKVYFMQMMGAGISAGSIKAMDEETAALAVMSMAIGLLLQGIVDPTGSDWTGTSRESIRVLTDGLARRSP